MMVGFKVFVFWGITNPVNLKVAFNLLLIYYYWLKDPKSKGRPSV